MAESVAYSADISVSTDGTSYNSMNGAYSPDMQRIIEELDSTDFDDAGERKRLPGLADSTISISAYSDYSDTAQNALRTAIDARSVVYIRYRPDGTNGVIIQGYVFSESVSGSVDGINESSFEIRQSAAISRVP